MIHPTAVIHPKADLHPSVRVGPYAVIDDGVAMEADCIVGPHVYITGQTTIGTGNRFFAGAVIGEAPQDLKYRDEPTGVRIGNSNVFREHVTVHRSTKPAEPTEIGSGNFLMAHSHVGHNARIGNHAILANGVLLGGHTEVHDRAFLSGNCLVHQFSRVGTFAMMQGGSAVSKDLPPFTIAYGANSICGLNIVGLRRGGFTPDERLSLKKLYHKLFRQGLNLTRAWEELHEAFPSGPARLLLEFVRQSRRGVISDPGRSRRNQASEESPSA